LRSSNALSLASIAANRMSAPLAKPSMNTALSISFAIASISPPMSVSSAVRS
jgi:hypothetical protein